MMFCEPTETSRSCYDPSTPPWDFAKCQSNEICLITKDGYAKTPKQGRCVIHPLFPVKSEEPSKASGMEIIIVHDPSKKPWFGEPEVIGEAQLSVKKGSSAESEPIKLLLGDAVTAPAGAEVVIRAGTHLYNLAPGSSLKLDEALVEGGKPEVTSTSLLGGVVRFLIPPRDSGETKFGVKSGTIATGVKGTQFIIDSSDNGDDVYVLDGEVEVVSLSAPSQKATVFAGNGITGTQEGLGKPQLVKANELAKKYPTLFEGVEYADDATIKKLKVVLGNKYVGTERVEPAIKTSTLLLAFVVILAVAFAAIKAYKANRR
ncbi:FecR domain-containing protein [Candidatus Woesearchaeota archaeon]|nr:FecR domain-containing protein [Candidatus Woesearchaeota archaeon]